MSVNKFIGIGNIGAEPESRQAGQSTVLSFRIALTERYKGQDGQLHESTEWVTCEYWNPGGVQQYLHKGTQVYVEGALRTDTWNGQDGQKHSQTKVRVLVCQLLGSKPQVQAPAQQPQAPQYPPQPQYPAQGFQQTGQFPQAPVGQPYPPQGQYVPGVNNLP